MSGKTHLYETSLRWTGDRGRGTTAYSAYGREHEINAPGKAAIFGSSDPAFRGDASAWNPEELLLASLSACHQLSYLHQCAVAGVVVVAYADRAQGWMEEAADGGGRFTRVLLRPQVTVAAGSSRDTALALHHRAHELCFIARSVNFPVEAAPAVAIVEAVDAGQAQPMPSA